MNLHAILDLHPDEKLFLMRGEYDGNAYVWFVKARTRGDAQRAFRELEKVHDADEIYGIDFDEITANWITTPDQTIAQLHDEYPYVFEEDGDLF